MKTYNFFLGNNVLKKIEQGRKYLLPMNVPYSDFCEMVGMSKKRLMELIRCGAPHYQDSDNRLWINGIDFLEWLEAFNNFLNFEPWDSWYCVCKECRQFIRMEYPDLSQVKDKVICDKGKCCYCGFPVDNKLLAFMIFQKTTPRHGRILWLLTHLKLD